MKKDYVYLCGGMEGYTEEQMSGWRQFCAERLDAAGISTLDPCRRATFHTCLLYTSPSPRDS